MRLRGSARIHLSLFCGLALALPVATSAQAVVRGIVLEAETEKPISLAFVELVNGVRRLAGVLTDSSGAFVMYAPTRGDMVLMVNRIGYARARRTIRIGSDNATIPPVMLEPKPVPVDPVIASTAEPGVLEERLKGYYRRRDLGAGYLLNEDRLKQTAGVPLSELLRGVPGIGVSTGRSTFGPPIFTNSNQIQTQVSPFQRGRVPNSQSPIGPCPMQLYIDGKHFSTMDGGVDVIAPRDLIAVEVLRGLAQAPAEFGGMHARCGIISVLTRRQPTR
jgi:hypothetical protein